MSENKIHLQGKISSDLSHRRLDQALAKLFPQYSRTQLQTWIRAGYVSLDSAITREVRATVLENQLIEINAPEIADERWSAQSIPLNIVYEDEDLIIINKPAGLIVHPGAGAPNNTLLNALLHVDSKLSTIPRAGIVHRLDKNTTGLLVIARNLAAHHFLTQAMKARKIERDYQAIVNGVLISGGKIDTKIGRHPTVRTRMAVVESGRHAVTHYRVIERFRAHTHIHVKLETGRTHQIRVHLMHIHHPIVGDNTYGRRLVLPSNCTPELKQTLREFPRQALHAFRLKLPHPKDEHPCEWQAPLPDDMLNLLQKLTEDTNASS